MQTDLREQLLKNSKDYRVETYFTSDTHFNHELMRKIRDYPTIEDMNEDIISRWNSTVKPNDVVYHHGDFSLRLSNGKIPNLLKRLNGKIHLILGNHDSLSVNKGGSHGFLSINQYLDKTIGDYRFKMFHYNICPYHHCNKPHVLHTFGHHHGRLNPKFNKFRSMDVGIDAHPDFTLFSYEEVVVTLLQKPILDYNICEI